MLIGGWSEVGGGGSLERLETKESRERGEEKEESREDAIEKKSRRFVASPSSGGERHLCLGASLRYSGVTLRHRGRRTTTHRPDS